MSHKANLLPFPKDLRHLERKELSTQYSNSTNCQQAQPYTATALSQYFTKGLNVHIHNISDLVRNRGTNETQRDYANNNHARQLITYLLHTDIQ